MKLLFMLRLLNVLCIVQKYPEIYYFNSDKLVIITIVITANFGTRNYQLISHSSNV